MSEFLSRATKLTVFYVSKKVLSEIYKNASPAPRHPTPEGANFESGSGYILNLTSSGEAHRPKGGQNVNSAN